MWAMLRTSLVYDGFSQAAGLYLTATTSILAAEMLKDWPGLVVREDEEYARLGVCWITVEAAAYTASKPPPAPLSKSWTVDWNAVQLFIIQRLGMDGWEPYAYGPNTSAGYPMHLLRKRLDANPS